MQVLVFQRLAGDELRQTLVTIGISIVAADLMLAVWGGKTYQFEIPAALDGAVVLPIVTADQVERASRVSSLSVLPPRRCSPRPSSSASRCGSGLNRTQIRHDDPRRRRRSRDAVGRGGQRALAVRRRVRDRRRAGGIFRRHRRLGAVVAPGEDVRYLLASLVVVIVGGMGSITGAAIGALLIGLAEQLGLVYFPTYGVVLTFAIMVVTLALRPQGVLGNARLRAADPPRTADASEIVTAEFNPATAALLVALILLPVVASPFFVFQIGAQSLILGCVALSLMVLAGYGGMVRSLSSPSPASPATRSRSSVPNGTGVLGLNWPWELYIPAAMLHRWRRQRADRRHRGAHGRHLHDHDHARGRRPGSSIWRSRTIRSSTATRAFAASRRPTVFGVDVDEADAVLLSVPRRRRARSTRPWSMARARPSAARWSAAATIRAACARSATASRRCGCALTFSSGLIAGAAGVLLVWFNGRISPGHGQRRPNLIGILVIAVIGGVRHPIGPFVGAAALRAAEDIRHRYRRRRSLQYVDRRDLSDHRLCVSRWTFRPVAALRARGCAKPRSRSVESSDGRDHGKSGRKEP